MPSLPQRSIRTLGALTLAILGGLGLLQPQIDSTPMAAPSPGTARAAGPAHVPLRVYTDDLRGTLIQGKVWHDLNLSGLHDPGEPGVPDVLVHLHHPDNGNLLAEAITDEKGLYSFLDLPPDRYEMNIRLEQLPGSYCLLSKPDRHLHLDHADHQLGDRNIALSECASLSGRVWEDLDASGNPAGEDLRQTGIASVKVSLHHIRENQRFLAAETHSWESPDNRGFFHFERLPPGVYELSVDEATVSIDMPNAVATSSVLQRITLGRGEQRSDLTFGFHRDLMARKIDDFEAITDDTGTHIRWRADVGDEAIGFFIHRRLSDGSTVRMHEHLVVADEDTEDYELFLPAISGGEFVIEEMNRDLDSQLGRRSSTAQIQAAPIANGEVLMVQAVDGEAELLTSAIFNNYLVIGFDKAPLIQDLTDEDAPLQPQGESLNVAGDHGVYFSAPPGSRILLNAGK